MQRQEKSKGFYFKGGTQIFLPLLLYVLVSRIIQGACSFLLPEEVYLHHPAALLGLENLLLFPLFYGAFYLPDQGGKAWKREAFSCVSHNKIGNIFHAVFRSGKGIFLIVGASVCLSRGLNQLLSLTLLPQRFPAYEKVTTAVYAEPFWVQLLVTTVAAPLLEELLMRGIVYRRMKRQTGNRKLALVGSAAIFGVFHGNLVQGLYAFFLGLLFAWVLERYQGLWAPMLSHGAVNGAALLQNKIPWMEGFPQWQRPAAFSFLTACLLLVGYGLLRCMDKRPQDGSLKKT